MHKDAISDQKRLVRGEHWLRARYFLRARDKTHHRRWRLLTIAGPDPKQEIDCIRDAMPSAHITSVDIQEANLLAAIDAGADETIQCDIGKVIAHETETKYPNGYTMRSTRWLPPKQMCGLEKFDAICLDLTGPADEWLKRAISVYYTEALTAKGVMMITFSYGRDVVEMVNEEFKHAIAKDAEHFNPRANPNAKYNWRDTDYLASMPDTIAPRVYFALRSRSKFLQSCLAYRGGNMPMVSCLLVKGRQDKPPAKFVAIEPEDFIRAVTAENIGNIYACPAERIAQLRLADKRSAAAHKAIATRRRNQLEEHKPKLLTYQSDDDGIE